MGGLLFFPRFFGKSEKTIIQAGYGGRRIAEA
jgi:hypothetical protein